MLIWLKKHSKTINFFGGIFILLITVVLYFWNVTSVEVSSGAKKSLSEQRMERSQKGSHSSQSKSHKPQDMTMFTKKLKDGKQVQNFILLLMVLGFSMLGFSLYSKYKEKKLS